MSRQVATLIERVQCLQPPNEYGDASTDAQSQFENPFGDPHWRRENLDIIEYKWENNIKVELHESLFGLKTIDRVLTIMIFQRSNVEIGVYMTHFHLVGANASL